MKIKGGYYLKARCIQESVIAHAPPHVREIWDWLLKECNHKDKKYAGFTVKRGQCFRSYKEIRDGLSWKVGYRKERYSENQTKKAMKFLRKHLMIATAKALGGVLITVIKYDTYQNPENYERTTESTNESTNAEPMRNQPIPVNNKNVKNVKKIQWVVPEGINEKAWKDFEAHRKGTKHWTDAARNLNIAVLKGNNHMDQQQIVDKSIKAGWTALYPLSKSNGNFQKNEHPEPEISEREKENRKRIGKLSSQVLKKFDA